MCYKGPVYLIDPQRVENYPTDYPHSNQTQVVVGDVAPSPEVLYVIDERFIPHPLHRSPLVLGEPNGMAIEFQSNPEIRNELLISLSLYFSFLTPLVQRRGGELGSDG